MKAICLLLCLALARQSAGDIFRRAQYPQMDRYIVQPMEYISDTLFPQSEQNSQEQYVPRRHLEKHHHQSRDHTKIQDADNSDSNSRQQYTQESQEEYTQQRNRQQKQRQQYPGQQKQQYQQYKDQDQAEKVQDTRSYSLKQYAQNSQEQYSQEQEQKYQPQQYQQEQQYQQHKYQPQQEQYQQQQNQDQTPYAHDSTSSSSSVESDLNEYRNNKYAMPVYADVKNQKSRFYRSQNEQPAFGDAIEWNGVRIAVQSQSPQGDLKKEDIEKIFGDAYKSMNHVNKERKEIYHQTFERAAKTVHEDAHLNATELLNKYQYAVETHTIKTDDGYLLTLFRIPSKVETAVPKPVVFLMHGLLGSADDWLLMGPGKSLAYLLADAGYEVWLGNARGNKYSRRHVSKHPAQADFWQFSNDEIALHDLPAMIDYALKTANQQKLYYVGYDQGTTAFFAMASTRPEYNEKIIMMYALAPMAYMANARSPLLRMIAPTSPLYERLHQQLGHGQFKPAKELVSTLGGDMCHNEIGCKNVCSNVNFVMSGINVNNLDAEDMPVIMAHLPAGASTRQLKQYAQAVASHEFAMYDYGAEINQKVYGSSQPRKYDMQKVQTPVAMYYSEKDWLAQPRDVNRLVQELPHVKSSSLVDPSFSHIDFLFSKQAPQMVYNRLIEDIQKDQQKQSNVY